MEKVDADLRTPGQLIKRLLNEREWSQRVLAIILGVEETAISKIISDNRPVTGEMALSLGEVFDVDPERFLNLQKSFELAVARIVAQPNPNRSARAALFGGLPVQEMIKRGWLQVEDMRQVAEVEVSLTRFFQADSIDEIEILPHAAKKTEVYGDATPTQLAWLYRVRQIANGMIVSKYSPTAVEEALKKLKPLMASASATHKIPRILAEAGIRFVIVESLPSAKIDGVCFWIDNGSPVIGMSLRYDRIDNFWFVLRHEIEHVIHRHGQSVIMLDTNLEGERAGTGTNVSEEERIANEAAADFGVTRRSVSRFIAKKEPLFTKRDLLGFATVEGVHPGIIAGKIQYATGRYELFRDQLVKIRSHIAPCAIVDGWGDVAPVAY